MHKACVRSIVSLIERSLPDFSRMRWAFGEAAAHKVSLQTRRPKPARYAPFSGAIVDVFDANIPKVNPHLGTTLALIAFAGKSPTEIPANECPLLFCVV